MLGKVWEVAILCIVVGMAAKLVTEMIAPLAPYLIGLAVIFSIGGTLYHRKRRW